jgi:hypothetical protein
MTVWKWMVLMSLAGASLVTASLDPRWYPDSTKRERKVVFAGCPSWQVPLSVARHMLDVSCSGSRYVCDALPFEATFVPGDITPFMALSETELTCGAPPQAKD